VRILQSYPGERATTNPYLTQLGNRLGARSELLTFPWTRALTDRYDVLHVHWPETLLRGRTPLRGLVRRLLFRALLARVRRRRTAVVRTVHNVRSHEEATPAERRLIERLDRRTTLWIRLNEATPVPGGVPVRTIEHGDYRDWFAGHALPEAQPGRMLYFGLIRSYKGLDALITAFAGLPAAPGPGAGRVARSASWGGVYTTPSGEMVKVYACRLSVVASRPGSVRPSPALPPSTAGSTSACAT